MRPDDFTPKTKRLLASRVGHVCSNPECRAPTAGPCLDPNKFVTAGDAAHITAASPEGPRYDSSLTPELRRSYDNGIWLCVNDARIVDQDKSRCSVELLRPWKFDAESRAREVLGRPLVIKISSPTEFARFVGLARSVIAALRSYNDKSTLLGITGLLAQMAQAAQSREIPSLIEIQTLPYPEGVVPHNPFLQDRFECSCTIRFPDGSEESGKASRTSGLELLMESRDSVIVAS
jgi:hypothetical protein